MLDLQSFQDSWWPYSVAFIVTVISAIRQKNSKCMFKKL